MSATAITPADLRPIDLFDDLDDQALAEWAAAARPVAFAAGELVADAGQPTPGVELLLEGSIGMILVRGERAQPAGRHVAPTWIGAIAALVGGPLQIRLEAETACRVALIEPEEFRRLAFAYPAVHQRVMRQILPVVGRVAGLEQERERLESLGTMAAGLAHELNNPAAAAARAADQLAEALEVIGSTVAKFVEAGVERADAEALLGLQRRALAAAAERPPLDALDAADAEDEMQQRLEALRVQEPWRLAEPLAAAGVDQDWLDRVAALAGPATGAALRWVAASLTARGLAVELQESTQRMSSLVKAVKTYAYMDRGEMVEVDLHEGLDTTLLVLGHKLKRAAIKVQRDYDRDLPRLTVRGSQLNQVWTNLIDNAIDAIGERGVITVTTRREGERAVVEIADDGPGIPPEVRRRIFDAFYTTKEVGQGTGLGLVTARRIVVEAHGGALDVESRPGRTVFRVSLPLSRT